MKILGAILAIILIAGIIFMGINVVDYMVNYNYTLGDSISQSWDDLMHLRFTKTSKGEIFLGYDVSNRIQLKGCYTN